MVSFVMNLFVIMGIFVILSLSLNLIAGYTGLLSLCHAAFYGIGAYVTAILMTKYNIDFLLSFFLSGIIASFFGFLIGLPTLRLKGDYLAIATLGFGEIINSVLLNWDSLTNGPMGINEIPPIKLLFYRFDPYGLKIDYAIFIWVVVFLTYLIISRIIRSRFGRALEAIREDEIASIAMGINVTKYKVFAFAIGAFFAGIAGSIFSSFYRVVVPGNFTFLLSIQILCMVVLGGMGNNLGAILGAIIIFFASELPRLIGLSSIIPPQFNQIIFGLILVFMMIFRPEGILKRKKIDFSNISKISKNTFSGFFREK